MKKRFICFIIASILSAFVFTSCTDNSQTTETKPTTQATTESTTESKDTTLTETTQATELTTIESTTTVTEPTTKKESTSDTDSDKKANSDSSSKTSDKKSDNNKDKTDKNTSSSSTNQSTANKNNNNNNYISNAEVSSISLSKTELSLKVGESKTLKITFNPDNAINKSYNVSTNNNKADINCSGSTVTVYGKVAGKSTLTVKSHNGKTATCIITVKPDPSTQENIPENPYQAYAQKVTELLNEERSKNGLSKLTLRKDITALANERAVELKTLYSHTRPDGTKITTTMINDLLASSTAENIARGQTTPEEVMTDWMNSKSHRENILSPKYDGVGIGYYESEGICYWVQLFVG